MAGIYIHIPFCKQACYYCDFHFSTSLKKKGDLVEALCKEIEMKKNKSLTEIETIYFGGGTPSLLEENELQHILDVIFQNYTVKPDAEITLEANPDDLSKEKIRQLSQSPVNRLSIGIQSFFEEDLKWMNRSHNARQALEAVKISRQYFDNISIDLIYGIPHLTHEKWHQNLNKALELGVPHISSYALTVEPKTALAKMIKQGKKESVEDALARAQYEILVERLTNNGFINYEFSNFGKPGYFSKNNTAYWMGKPYLGIGPSAHGFDGEHRFWNVRNNTLYINKINADILPQEQETLTPADRYNEYIMTRLRTMWGVSKEEISTKFGRDFADYFEKEAEKLLAEDLLTEKEGKIHISPSAKFLGDGISSDLFFVD